MLLCHRGCELESTYVNYKGMPCCNKRASQCPIIKKKIGSKNAIALTGKQLTKEHKSKISKGLTGHKVSDETKEKIRQGNKATKKQQTITPWNKGLNASDPRVEKYASSQRGKKRKQELPEILSREDIAYRDFRKYRNRIAVRTKKTYEQFKAEINPHNLPIGKAGIDGAYHIDHIISVREGFDKGISIEEMSAKDNLQMLPWLDNLMKYDGKRIKNES